MGRKKYTCSREQLKPDSQFKSPLVSKFINCLMWDGKKSVATRVFMDAMDIVAKRVNDTPPLEVFETAINNIKPNIEVRSKRVGGSNYQVPIQVNKKRQQSLAIRWVLQAIRAKSGKPISVFLAQEFMDAFKREGTAMTTRENVHRMAEANKAFAHFAW
jgi:small subunit ribosomal protein S7